MSEEDGGVEESISSSARIALTVAIQLGEKLAHAYQEAMREAQHRDAVLARELAVRFEGERASARHAVAVVNDPQWWDTASVQDIARVAETTTAWKNDDLQIARADAVIASQALERYGVDVATLRAIARDTPNDLDLAKQWALTSAPEDYHRHDEDRLTLRVGDGIEPNVTAERALVADYRAAIAGDVPALELSVAEEWKRANDPTGYQDYRVETTIAFDDNGRSTPVDPAVAEVARATLVEEWRSGQAGGLDERAERERARSHSDLTEAQMMIAEADRVDRFNDAARSGMREPVAGTGALSELADELDGRALEYDRDADNGGTVTRTPNELRELAVDARAQAALYRDESTTPSTAVTEPSTAPTGQGRAGATRAESDLAYDSAERRSHTAEAMRANGVPEAQIHARMTVDASFSTPARDAASNSRTAVPRTRSGRGQGQRIERPEQSR